MILSDLFGWALDRLARLVYIGDITDDFWDDDKGDDLLD